MKGLTEYQRLNVLKYSKVVNKRKKEEDKREKDFL
jgi:hypothetical protein